CEFNPLPGLDALGALLDAIDETIRSAPAGSIRDPARAQAISASLADARAALRAGGMHAPALRTALRRLVGSVRRALHSMAAQRDLGFRLLDLSRRARALLVPGRRPGAPTARGGGGAGPGVGQLETPPR